MWENLKIYFQCLRSSAPKAVPNKPILFLRKFHFLRRIVSDEEIKPVQDLGNLKSSEIKKEVKRVLVSSGFYSTLVRNLHVNLKPPCELLRDEVPFKCSNDYEKLFRKIEDRISEETILVAANPHYPFHTHDNFSGIGAGSF